MNTNNSALICTSQTSPAELLSSIEKNHPTHLIFALGAGDVNRSLPRLLEVAAQYSAMKVLCDPVKGNKNNCPIDIASDALYEAHHFARLSQGVMANVQGLHFSQNDQDLTQEQIEAVENRYNETKIIYTPKHHA